MSSTKLKANFAVEYKYGAFYTGGKVQVSGDGEYVLCQCGCQLQVVQVSSGKVDRAIGQEEDEEVTCFCLSPDDQVLVVACRSLQLKQWDWKQNVVTRTWRAVHTGPVSCMSFDSTSTLLATGGSDSTVKVWDIIRQYCTHNLRGHQGVVSVAQFHPDITRLQLITAADDYKIRVWDLKLSSCLAVLESHFSVITALQISADGNTLYSGGRDKVVTVWSLDTFEKKKTVPVFETLEGLLLLPEGQDYAVLNASSKSPHFITAGDKGVLKVWNSATGQCVFQQVKQEPLEKVPLKDGNEIAPPSNQAITALLHSPAKDLVLAVTHDHNIVFHNQTNLSAQKQLVGNMDEILDLKFLGEEESHIIVASNSELIKVFDLLTWDCQILRGHTDTVVSVDVDKTRSLFVTGSKDNSLRVWRMDSMNQSIKCVAVGHGHTHSVSGVALSRTQQTFVVSGSEDCTLKLWPLPSDLTSGDLPRLTSRATEKAHDKEINAVVVAPNDKLIATGSQDKTAKLWNATDLSLLGVFRGHRRGVWCVQFSPVDQCLATGSGDGTIKLWSITEFSCVKTFEGHDSLILKVDFLSRGMQLISSGSDGLVKLWNIKSNECVRTLDEHEEKIWALTVARSGERFATGAGDSTLILWKDVTQIELEEVQKKQEEFILKEQALSNLVKDKKYLKAIGLAITLEQPFRVLNIMKEILNVSGGRDDLEKTVEKLRMDQLDAVLRYAAQWNTNAKHCHVSQSLISVLLKTKSPEDMAKFPNFKSSLEGLLPYTDRHMARMNRLLQQAMFVEYTWQSMRLISGPRPVAGAIASNRETKTALQVGKCRTDRVGDLGLNVQSRPSDAGEAISDSNSDTSDHDSNSEKFEEKTASEVDSDNTDQESDMETGSNVSESEDKQSSTDTSDSSENESNSEHEQSFQLRSVEHGDSNGHAIYSRKRKEKPKSSSSKVAKKSKMVNNSPKILTSSQKAVPHSQPKKHKKGANSKLKSSVLRRKRRKVTTK